MADLGSEENQPDPQDRKRRRHTSFLKPDQLKRKRELDREGQRQLRARTRSHIQDLEAQVAYLSQKLRDASAKEPFLRTPDSESSFGVDTPRESVISQQSIDGSVSPLKCANKGWSGINHNTNTFIRNSDVGIDSLVLSDLFAVTPYPMAEMSSDFISPSFNSEPLPSVPRSFETNAVWEAIPKHLPPTCRLDKIFMDLIRLNKTSNNNGQNTFEFSNARFPSVNLLLNPEEQPGVQPITSAIVKDVIYVQTVPELPEQIAIMFVMCLMIRWQISPTEQNFDALPDFLKPVPAQLVTAHPAWLDVFPWPKARERICRHNEYHDKHDYFKAVCNQTISINWPFEPCDTLLVVSDSEFMINPIFEKHIRNLANWTVGPPFLGLFPAFCDDVNIGVSRGCTS